MLSWEYPPKLVGGLARHVMELSEALVNLGHEVDVITSSWDDVVREEEMNGVRVHRVGSHGPTARDIVDTAMLLNLGFLEEALRIGRRGERFDLIHAHDWLAAYAAKALKHAWKRPMVATIHATEFGRNQGIHNDLQRKISDVEWWLTYEAWRVICCSQFMKREINYVFQTPLDKIDVIPNGVRPSSLQVSSKEGLEGFRQQFAQPTEKIVFHIGRLVHEKGASVLLEAIPSVLGRCPNTKFVIAGSGPAEAYLRQRAHELGISASVRFIGHVGDEVRNKMLAVSDVAVFPSLYEPFGIVALEAMAAKVPVVVSDTGGLAELVRHAENGYKAYPGDVRSLADNIAAALLAEDFSKQLARAAYYEVLAVYDWKQIAADTVKVYEKVFSQFAESNWRESWEVETDIANRFAHLSRTAEVERYQVTATSVSRLH